MKINKLQVDYNNVVKKFDFFDKTIIFSKSNSVGKSTLLRMIFYGLGYPIPSTVGLKFKKMSFRVMFSRDGHIYKTKRNDKYIEIYKDDDFLQSYDLNNNYDYWLTYIWGIDNPVVFKNVLGAMYMDQDKGWTLLNRGKVIGGIRFNVRDLLIGLSNSNEDFQDRLYKLYKQKELLKQTRQLIKLKDSSMEYQQSNSGYIDNLDDSELYNKYKNLTLRSRTIKGKLKELKYTIKERKHFKNYLTSLNIMVKDSNDKTLILNDDNIINFDDNIEYLKQRSAILQENLDRINSEISELKIKMTDNTENLFDSGDIVEKIFSNISKLDINKSILESRVDELSDSIESLNKDIEDDFIKNNELIDETKKWLNFFANKLGVLDIVSDKKYLFTRDLKSISGTIYYKVVFSFKMAYIKIIEQFSQNGICLPIILDSPSGREVTSDNISEVIKILNDYFKNNQIIIASINDYELDGSQKIVLQNKIFE